MGGDTSQKKKCYHEIPTLELMMILSSPNIFPLIKKNLLFSLNNTDFLGKRTNTFFLKYRKKRTKRICSRMNQHQH